MPGGKGIGAVFKTAKGSKYTIQSDGIVTITAKSGDKEIEYKNVRVVGMSRGNDAVRVVADKGGVNEIPTKFIIHVVDSSGQQPSCVQVQ